MANPNPTRNRVKLVSPSGRHDEAPAGIACYPGHMLQEYLLSSVKSYRPHIVPGGFNTRLFAIEDALQGRVVTTQFAIGDIVSAYRFLPGDVVFARIAVGTKVTGNDEKLMSNGDGTLSLLPAGTQLFEELAAGSTVTNTVAETAFTPTYTVPANFLQVGDIIHIRARVDYPSTNATDTATIKLYIGATVIVATGAVDVANGDVGVIDAYVTIRTIGASGTLTGSGIWSLGVPGTATDRAFTLASTAVDTTATQLIKVTQTWSVANAGDQAVLNELSVDLDRAGGLIAVAEALDVVDNSASGLNGNPANTSTGTTDEFCAVRLL